MSDWEAAQSRQDQRDIHDRVVASESEERRTEAGRLDEKVRLYGVAKTTLAALFVLFVLVSTTINVWTLTEVQDTSKGNSQTLQRLVECTTPGYECYDNSAARTGEAIGNINRYTLAAAWCARSLPAKSSEAQYRVCVTTRVTVTK